MERKDSLVGQTAPSPTTPSSVDKPMTSAMINQPAEVETPAMIRECESPLGTEEKMILTDAIKREEVVVEPRERNPDKSHLFTYQYHGK